MGKLLSAALALCLCVGFALNASAEDAAENNTEFLPGSGGMRYLDENNQEHFISANDILAYGFQEESMPASQSWNEDDSQSRGAVNDNWSIIDPVGNYSPIVLIESYFSKEPTFGTGALIGPTGILTCAHALYDRDTGKWANKTYVYTQFSKGSYLRKYEVSGRYIGGEYDNRDFDDWGIVTLNSAPNVGYFGYSSTTNIPSILNSLDVTAAGYVEFEGNGPKYLSLLKSKGTILRQLPNRSLPGVAVNCDVFPGMSGGPLHETNSGSIRGILIEQARTASYNVALLINPWLFNAISEHSGR